MVLLVTNKGKH